MLPLLRWGRVQKLLFFDPILEDEAHVLQRRALYNDLKRVFKRSCKGMSLKQSDYVICRSKVHAGSGQDGNTNWLQEISCQHQVTKRKQKHIVVRTLCIQCFIVSHDGEKYSFWCPFFAILWIYWSGVWLGQVWFFCKFVVLLSDFFSIVLIFYWFSSNWHLSIEGF